MSLHEEDHYEEKISGRDLSLLQKIGDFYECRIQNTMKKSKILILLKF